MSRLLDDSVVFQLRIWGYGYTGDVIEPGSLTAEHRPRDRYIAEANRLFDRTRSDLSRWRSGLDDGWRAPDHWALPWVTEHRMRQEMADAR